MKIEDMGFQCALCAPKGRSQSNARHGRKRLARGSYLDSNRIHSIGRYKLVGVGQVEIGRGVSYPTTLFEAMNDLAHDGLGISQTAVGQFYLAAFQKCADNRGT